MSERIPKKLYEKELKALQVRLVDMQAWVQASGARVVVIFEGRDAAGKGSTISRVSQYLNPALRTFGGGHGVSPPAARSMRSR